MKSMLVKTILYNTQHHALILDIWLNLIFTVVFNADGVIAAQDMRTWIQTYAFAKGI